MTDRRNGKVVTFYSFKGGTGRTMALANVAWILAASGRRVLVVDWDLESPGLHRFFGPFVDGNEFAATGGVIDLIRDYEWAALQGGHDDEQWREQFARVHNFAFSLRFDEFPPGGGIDFLSAGRQDRDYAGLLSGLNWDNFYGRLGGGEFLDSLRADMQRHYDYTLIDSRTGMSDNADICTVHLPDVLVACFTLSGQGIDGAARVAAEVKERYRARKIRILPVPMRIDLAEKDKANIGRLLAKLCFAGLPELTNEAEHDKYWTSVQVPYQAFYAYEETLATFTDVPGAPGSLLAAYETLTSRITDGEVASMPPMPEATRRRISSRFVRQGTTAEDEVTLRYAPEDQVWAEWIAQVLEGVGIRVNDPNLMSEGAAPESTAGRPLVVVSEANWDLEGDVVRLIRIGVTTPLAIYVADMPALPGVSPSASMRMTGQTAASATEQLLRLVGFVNANVPAVLAAAARFPGDEPVVSNAPARNPRFTGRERDLRVLRKELRAGGSMALTPVALQGLGGIGKTVIAAEYAHRFRGAYDVVWWVDADPASFVSGKISDLVPYLGLPNQPTGAENTRSVLQALGRGEPYPRWLLIMDSADDIKAIEPFLPKGAGHILITSTNQEWGDRARAIDIDVFDRAESVGHLVHRVPTMSFEEANRVADALGDLPIAVAVAAAWLDETGTPVDDYLRQIELHGPRVITQPGTEPDAEPDHRVEATWDLSLQRLMARSPAAYRLLQLCSLLAPEIALRLVYSDGMAAVLARIDPRVADRLFRGTLVQAMNRLTLVKIDQQRGYRGEMLAGDQMDRVGQIVVHRLLQQVVRLRMTADEREIARHEIHGILTAARPNEDVDTPDTWSRYRILWPHLEASEAADCVEESVRQLLIDRVRYLYLLGDLVPALDLARRIEATWVKRLASSIDPEATDILQRQLLLLRFNLANIMRAVGRFEDAYKLDQAGREQQEQLLGPEHPHVLLSAGSLAGDLRGLGRYEEALARDEATHRAWVDSFGEDHERSLNALSNLAVSNRLMGRFRMAYKLDVQVHRRRQVVLNENHPKTYEAAGNVGRDVRDAGDFDESIAILTSVVENYIRIWGPEARWTLVEQANLCVSLRKAGRPLAAVELLDKAYDKLKEIYGPDSPDTMSVGLSRAMNQLALKDPRALDDMQRVHDAYVRNLGPQHPQTLACVNNLALVHRANEDKERALELVGSAADRLAGVLDATHPRVLSATLNLAICTAEVNDFKTAVGMANKVAAGMVDALGSDHPDTLRAKANDIFIRRLAGNVASDGEFETALGQLARRLGDRHPAVSALRTGRLLHKIIDPHPF